MTPKDLEHWKRIFKAGAAGAGNNPIGNALMRMASTCRKIRDEENKADREDGGGDVRV